jgi:hypothetical protein
MDATQESVHAARPPIWTRAYRWWLVQVRHMLPSVTFFFIGFNLVLWTKEIVLQQHGIPFTGFMVATLAALLVGKAVLVTDHLPFMRRFEGAPLIQPILFKSAIYWAVVFIVRLAEGFVHFVLDGGSSGAFLSHVGDIFSWPRFLLVQVWLMVLFLIYVTIHELNALFGYGELPRLFFRWRSSEAKLTRRHRIRLLAQLSRLTETHELAELKNPSTAAHAELVEIVTVLASRQAGAGARA